MAKDGPNSHKQEDAKQASTVIAVSSVIGLTACFIVAVLYKAEIPLYLYAIFGGGILGTDNVLKFIRAIFKVK